MWQACGTKKLWGGKTCGMHVTQEAVHRRDPQLAHYGREHLSWFQEGKELLRGRTPNHGHEMEAQLQSLKAQSIDMGEELCSLTW